MCKSKIYTIRYLLSMSNKDVYKRQMLWWILFRNKLVGIFNDLTESISPNTSCKFCIDFKKLVSYVYKNDYIVIIYRVFREKRKLFQEVIWELNIRKKCHINIGWDMTCSRVMVCRKFGPCLCSEGKIMQKKNSGNTNLKQN